MEIDFSAIPQQTTSTPSTWKPPRHVYFGPKDPATGQMMDEPIYTFQAYPKMVYAKREDRLVARIVNSKDEWDALGKGWSDSISSLGVTTAPSFEEKNKV